MELEVRFTPKGTENEIPFTIGTDRNDKIRLYSGSEYSYILQEQDGTLSLLDPNPFEEPENIVEERLIGLSANWIESKSQGFENSSGGEERDDVKPGYGPDDIFVENKPFSLRQIVELIDSGDIDLTPDFQRNFIWDKTRQSRLIESIFLGLPLPSIYLSQYDDGRLTIVDGLQRLSTIKEFFDGKLTLWNLEYLTECNGKKYTELVDVLSPLRLRKFGQTQIMCFVIDYRSPSKLKFDLFRRLNTGGKPLNNQEIRNCLSRRHLQKVLREMVSSEEFGRATDHSVKDTRMEAQESALRFMYFLDQYKSEEPYGAYSGLMDETLDAFVDDLNKRDDNERYVSIYKNALKCAYHLFGKQTFRKVYPNYPERRRTPINKLLMLTISVLLTKYDYATIQSNFEENCLIDPLAQIIDQNSDFFSAITWSTNAKWNIKVAFDVLKRDLFDKHLVERNEQ